MEAAVNLDKRKGSYGLDAPYLPLLLGAFGAWLVLWAMLSTWRGGGSKASAIVLLAGVALVGIGASYLYTTRTGKFAVWAELLGGLKLRGNERLLDLGCGRGAVLLMAAQLLPRGRAVGVDLWRTSDQTGNNIKATLHNAELEGVAQRIELHTGDIRELPFRADSFHAVVSSLAVHHIRTEDGRRAAIAESCRVLRPGGRLMIVDRRATVAYEQQLRELGMAEVARRRLGWRFWYGGPWMAATLLTATKPGSS